MPYYKRERYFCSYCHEIFIFEEDATHHEQHYCVKSPFVEEMWSDSSLNPHNLCCATCVRSASFLTKYGCYEESATTPDCPQRLMSESDRTFPCPSYVRCLSVPAAQFDTREFTEIALRYLRSFGL